jgi:site-specific recombinase XerD
MNIKFFINKQKPDTKGKCQIFLKVHIKGKLLRYYTGEKCLPKFWDDEKQRFKKSMAGYQEANDFLDTLKEKLAANYRKFISQGKYPDISELKESLKPQKESTISFMDYFLEFIQFKTSFFSFKTIKGYKDALHHLQDFEYAKKVNIENLDVKFIDLFIKHLSKKGLSKNSINTHLIKIKAFFKYIEEVKDIPVHKNYKTIPTTFSEVEKSFLTMDEIEAIKNLQLPANLDKTRQVFLFSCFTGLAYQELKNLSSANIKQSDNYTIISIKRKKTNKIIELALNQFAIQILEYFKDIPNRMSFLPVKSIVSVNIDIKAICKLAGITQEVELNGKKLPKYQTITFHSGRHTFATLSLIKGMNIKALQEILGHSDLKTTMIYAKIVDEFKHKQMIDVWNDKETDKQ